MRFKDLSISKTAEVLALKADSLEELVTHDMLVLRMSWREKTSWMPRAVIAQ